MRFCILILSLCWGFSAAEISAFAQEQPYKLGVQENVQGQPSTYSYPPPQMIPVPATTVPPAARLAPKPAPMPIPRYNGQASSNNTPEAFSVGVSKVALPPPFLGSWQVHGQRTKVDAMPEFQAAAGRSFSLTNDQIWNISGNQASGYTLSSNTGISTALIVDKVEGSTAFVRYQHPVGNTMAQEAIVMRLAASGMQFDGLERISIVKQGLPQPRAQVTYSLAGIRQ